MNCEGLKNYGGTAKARKNKYTTKIPPARIKKIIQTDEDIGKVANAVPVMIGRTLELFISQLVDKMADIAQLHHAKTLSPQLLKAAIKSEPLFKFLEPVVVTIPDLDSPEAQTSTSHGRRRSSQASDTTTKEKPAKKPKVSQTKRPSCRSSIEEEEENDDREKGSVVCDDCE